MEPALLPDSGSGAPPRPSDSEGRLPLLLSAVTLDGTEGVRIEAPWPGLLLPDASGLGYARFALPCVDLLQLVERFASQGIGARDPLGGGTPRAISLLLLQDAVLEGELSAETLLDALARRLPAEPDEQLLQRMLVLAEGLYWRFLSPNARTSPNGVGARWVAVVAQELNRSPSRTRTAALFQNWRNLALDAGSLARLQGILDGSETLEGFELGEGDRSDLALHLALRGVPGWEEILNREARRIENPDRNARFTFLRPSVDPDPAVRLAFFEGLARPENRRPEPWVIQGMQFLNHPIRGATDLSQLRAALDLLPEIQRTGDIFFPAQWVDAALFGQGSAEVEATVRTYLRETPDLNPRLQEKVLQSLDPVTRAAQAGALTCSPLNEM